MAFLSFRLTAANGFAVASVKPSGQTLGRDRAPSRLTFGPEGIQGRNVTLKGLILQAYEVLPHQVAAGPEWLDLNEYDIDARSEGRATPKELRIMLQTLLKERFHLTFHDIHKGRFKLEADEMEIGIDRNAGMITVISRGNVRSDMIVQDGSTRTITTNESKLVVKLTL